MDNPNPLMNSQDLLDFFDLPGNELMNLSQSTASALFTFGSDGGLSGGGDSSSSSFTSSFRPFPREPALSRSGSPPMASSPLSYHQQQHQQHGMVTMHSSDYANLDSLTTSSEGLEMMIGDGRGNGGGDNNYETWFGDHDDGASLLEQLGDGLAEVKVEVEGLTPPTMPTIFEIEGSAMKKRKHEPSPMMAGAYMHAPSPASSSSSSSSAMSSPLSSSFQHSSSSADPPRLYAQPMPAPRPSAHAFEAGAPTLQSTAAATAMALFPQTSSSSGLPQQLPMVNPAHQQLLQVHQLQQQHKEQLDKMRHVQRQLMHQPEMSVYKQVDVEQKHLKQKLEEELQYLHKINRTYVLEPQDLHKYTFLRQELELQLQQLELFMRELQLLLQPPAPRCIAALAILRQPFPMVITKSKELSEQNLQVQLFTGSAVDITNYGSVRASMIIDSHQVKGEDVEKALGACLQSLDPVTHIAQFPLKFNMGTRKSSVTIKFSMQLQVGHGENAIAATVESEMSRHFVVITNEIQWQGSAGSLLKRDAFDGQLEITWPQFANALQRHVLKATKQDPVRPARCMSGYDLKYMRAKFFGGKEMISQKDFDAFWTWFGKNLQILRYQRHIASLWQQGLIYGFLTRVDVNNALNGQEPGTFLLRFSERHSGQFAIAYVGMEKPHKIKHYLVQKSDTAGAKKTLPDFLGECPQFRFLLQLSTNPTTGEAVFRKLQKDVCLKPFYSKRDPPPSGSGYDPL